MNKIYTDIIFILLFTSFEFLNMIGELNTNDVKETVNAMELLRTTKITYSIGMRGNCKLEINDEDINYVFQSINKTLVKLGINKKYLCIKFYKSENGKDWLEFNDEFEYGTLDLSNNGDRWEGSCLNGSPCGYGKKYDDNNNLVYRGFIFNGKKICFGEEYYDNGIIEYRGTYINDNRHGHGCLYDKKGELIYEGYWSFNKNDGFNLNIPNNCADDGLIHNLVRELKIGDYCYNDWNELKLNTYPNLTVFTVGRSSLRKITSFELINCDKLTELIVGKETMLNTRSCILMSV